MSRFALAAMAATWVALLAAAGAGATVRILAVGDFGVGGPAERATGEAMRRFDAQYPADLMVTLGDNDYTKSPGQFRQNFRDAFGWLGGAGVAVAGVLGNHDYEVDRGTYELPTLGMPARYYARRVGDAELFMLDSNEVDSAQTLWLEGRLKRSDAPWKIAVLHHPPFVCGQHEGNVAVLARWAPLFRRYGVDLVLSGHEHSYQRFLPHRGVVYVVSGGGGAGLYELQDCPDDHPTRAAARMVHEFLSIVVDPDRLRVSAFDLAGHRIDRFRLSH